MRHFLLAAGALLLMGCTDYHTDNPSQITDTLSRSMSGHPVNDFFREHGNPINEVKLDDGHIYRWTSAFPSVQPASYVTPDYPSENGYEYAKNPDGSEGTAARNYCEVHIYTDREDVIDKIAVAVDTMGKWSVSRCSEVLYSTM